MAFNSTSQWTTNNALSVVVRDRILDNMERIPVIANSFATDDTGSVRGLVHRVDRWPDLSGTAFDVTEGTPMTSTTITATSVAITPAIAGIAAEFSDLLAGSLPFAGWDPAIRQMASALVEEVDDDIAALFTALNGGTGIGTSASDATLADWLTAMVTLMAAQAPHPYFGVIHPVQAGDLALSVGGFTTAVTGGTFAGGGAAAAGGASGRFIEGLAAAPGAPMGVIAGVPVFVSARCPLVNTSADRSGFLGNMDAITVARKWNVRTELERNALGVSTIIATTMAYGVAETADNFGVPFETDA